MCIRDREKIEHRPSKMLVRLPNNLGSATRRKLIAKRDLKIAQRDAATMSVERGSDGSKDLRHAITGIAREARHSLSRSLQSKPFETVTNSFPDRTHGAIVNIVRPRGA